MASATTGIRCDSLNLEVGMVLSRNTEYVVRAVNGSSITISNGRKTWNIDRDILANECYDTHATGEVKEVTRTEMVELLLDNIQGRVFEAKFKKQNGEERVMRGVVKYPERHFGRTVVKEIITQADGDLKHQERQLDHRTIEEITFAGTKYIVRGRKRKASGGNNSAATAPTAPAAPAAPPSPDSLFNDKKTVEEFLNDLPADLSLGATKTIPQKDFIDAFRASGGTTERWAKRLYEDAFNKFNLTVKRAGGGTIIEGIGKKTSKRTRSK